MPRPSCSKASSGREDVGPHGARRRELTVGHAGRARGHHGSGRVTRPYECRGSAVAGLAVRDAACDGGRSPGGGGHAGCARRAAWSGNSPGRFWGLGHSLTLLLFGGSVMVVGIVLSGRSVHALEGGRRRDARAPRGGPDTPPMARPGPFSIRRLHGNDAAHATPHFHAHSHKGETGAARLGSSIDTSTAPSRCEPCWSGWCMDWPAPRHCLY